MSWSEMWDFLSLIRDLLFYYYTWKIPIVIISNFVSNNEIFIMCHAISSYPMLWSVPVSDTMRQQTVLHSEQTRLKFNHSLIFLNTTVTADSIYEICDANE